MTSAEINSDNITAMAHLKTLPEDILLCIDVGEEMAEPWDARTTAHLATRLRAVKESLCCFVKQKLAFDRRHRFGVCLLSHTANIILPFTSEDDIILAVIDSLGVVHDNLDGGATGQTGFNFDDLFPLLDEFVSVDEDCAPSRILRVVILYGRSYTVPTLSINPILLQRPHIYLDALYVHKKSNQEGVLCQETYDFFIEHFDVSDSLHGKTAYFFEVASSSPRLYQHMMMLLAHPVQRDDQDTFLDNLEYIEPTD